MRLDGILRRWDDARGFGFIAPTRGGAELFVHISAFGQGSARPVEGETVSFELGRGKDGKPQAVNVVRKALDELPAASPPPARHSAARQARTAGGPSVLGGLLSLVLIVGVVAAAASWGYDRYRASAQRRSLEQMPAVAAPVEVAPDPSGFRCDGRTQCSQMTSCAEATWFINHCPGTKMDGNHDGVPCEQQWCTGVGAR